MVRTRSTSTHDWADACSSAFVPLNVRSSSARFAATLDHIPLTPDVAITRVASAASEVYRNAQTITAHPRETLLLSLHRSGRGSISQHGRTADLSTGAAALYDAGAPYTLRFPGRMSEAILQVPRSAISRGSASLSAVTASVLPTSPGLRALSGLLWADDLAANDAAIASSATELLRAAITTDEAAPPPSVPTEHLYLILREHIRQHSDDPELDVEALAHHHHISMRLVHRLFADHNRTPASTIRHERLTRAAADLRQGHNVTAVALRNGFTNPDTFSRAYKRHYGMTPQAHVSAMR